ncbi:hypothetical protein [Thermocaproicibacter melissae]
MAVQAAAYIESENEKPKGGKNGPNQKKKDKQNAICRTKKKDVSSGKWK